MPFIHARPLLIVAAIASALIALTAESSSAQTLGAPQVTVLADNSIVVSYAAPSTPPANAVLVGTLNGAPIGPFTIGTQTNIYSGAPVPAGAYTVQVVWGGGVVSPVTAFLVGPGGGAGARPGQPIMRPATLSANNVTLTWDPSANATSYELEAVMFETGQVFSLAVGNQTSLVVPDVPFGNYTARVRGRNSLGVGPYSNQILVSIVSTIRLRDLEVTLTWNSLADMDLHIIEPNGTHVSWQLRQGLTARLERDNTTGFGPETASVAPNGAARGVYQVYIVHYRGAFPTTSTISVSLNVGSSNVQTALFTRQSEAGDASRGYNVALVDPRSGIIGEVFGTRSALEIQQSPKPE